MTTPHTHSRVGEVVTGGSDGIGGGVAIAMGKAGAKVAVTSRREPIVAAVTKLAPCIRVNTVAPRVTTGLLDDWARSSPWAVARGE